MGAVKRVLCGLVAALVFCLWAEAHPGKTDSRGGHYNRTTGVYHYHHGYPEHQHTGGVCPYDFDDKTGENSGGNGGSGGTGNRVSTTVKKSNGSALVGLGGLALWFSPLIWEFTADVRDKHRKRREQENAFAKNREEFRLRYEGKSLREAAGVPSDCEMDEHGMPHTAGSAGTKADAFTVYVTQSGSVYHRAWCRYARTGSPVNLCRAVSLGKKPCGRCRPMDSVPDWVRAYQTLDKLRKRYRVNMLP